KALADYLEARSNLDDECLFLGQRGPLTPAGVRHLLRQYGRQAGLTALGPHALRHTFAYTYLAQNPGDLVGLAQILGHADVRTTAIYGQKRLADLAAGMERVNFYDV
ncbi:MAG: tyrosine-type recombinase/integrase, partial [Chloroflexi bacterium]|nr:tyrosine-type recombinase/integrase [Chloroflexota bacterium]